MRDHPDFQVPWCQELLSSPSTRDIRDHAFDFRRDDTTNAMFQQTLYNGTAILAHLSFRQPARAPDAIVGTEDCNLISVGAGVDGKTGRAHGGFNALILDQLTGSCAFFNTGPDPIPPATARLEVEYKAPVSTPCVVLARAWVTRKEGRKIWTAAVIEDGEGKPLATAKALYITARPGPKL